MCLSFYPTDNVAYLSSPGHDFGEHNQEWESDESQTDPLMDERWSSATLKILSSMPSRTIGGSCQKPVKTLMLRKDDT